MKVESSCSMCGKSVLRRADRMKMEHHFCSRECMGAFRKKQYVGENNPNFRNRMYDSDGYRLIHSKTIGREKLHIHLVKKALGLQKLPIGYHVHHRDCDHLNNNLSNLALLDKKDHQWLHRQYGSAVLWAYMNSKIDLETLVNWSNDTVKARKLLTLSIEQQIGVFKSDELLENPGEDNQQPS